MELRTRLQERYGATLVLADSDDLALPASGSEPLEQGARQEVQLTLAALGYEGLEINRALRAVAGQSDLDQNDADAWLRECLRWLSRAQAA